MAIRAGSGFVDLLPRINAAAFTAAANAQLAPAGAKASQSFSTSFAAGFKKALVPVGAAAAGIAAFQVGKLTLDFENAFTRIAAISNASAAQIDRWRSSVFELGRATAVAPAKLADGLFFLASAGLKANQIFPALEASAKGAAIGLGEMEDITRTVAQVLNAYPEAGLKAIDVVDALTAAVRESTAEPEEFAQALGRLLPIASKASVGVEELVASLATLSNIGLDVDEGVTGVRQVLNLIVSPGKQATETMNDLGIATEDLRQRLAGKGLINTLRFLERRVGGNEDQFRKLLPNIRAMTAAFGLTVQEAEKVDGIFRRVAASAGDTGRALEETAAGPGFKFRKAIVALQEVAIKLGQVFLPVATQIAQGFTVIAAPVADLLALLSQVPGAANAIAIAFLGWAALKFIPGLLFAIGRGLTILGAKSLAFSIGSLALNLAELSPAFIAATAAAAAGLSLIPAAVFALGRVTGDRQTKAFEGLKDHIRDVGVEAAETDGSLRQLRRSVAAQHGVGFRLPTTSEQREAVRRDFEKLTTTLDKQARAQAIANTEIEKFQKQIGESQPGLRRAAASIADITDQNFTEFSRGLRGALAAGTVDVRKWRDFVADTMGKASEAFTEFKDKAFDNLNFVAGALSDMSTEATNAQRELREGTDATGQALIDLREQANLTPAEILRGLQRATDELKAFGRDLLEITRLGPKGERLSEFLLSLGPNAQAAAAAVADAPRKVQQQLANTFAQGEGAAETLANKLTRRILGTLNQIRDVLEALGRAWGIEVEEQGADETKTKLDLILSRMREIDGTVATATVTTIFNAKKGTGFDPRQDGVAAGAVVGAQHGGVTRRPTLLVGEGGGHTSFGKGSEAILPLDDHTVGRLGASIAAQIRLPMIVVEADGEAIGRVASRQQRRRRQLVGA